MKFGTNRRLKSAQKGNHAAFFQLFDENQAAVFRFAYRLTGSVADAEDIVQEVFLALLRPGSRFDPNRSPLRSYLFGAVRNQALKRQRRRERAEDSDPGPIDLRSPEEDTIRAEMEGTVARAVMALPETQRAVLILAHYEQMPVAEIAEVMEIEPGAVKSRLQRARAALKEALAAYAPGVERAR